MTIPAQTRVAAAGKSGVLWTALEPGDRWAHVKWDGASVPTFVPAHSLTIK